MVAGNIAERLEDLRKHLGLRQPAFAKLFGRGRKQASAWKNSRQSPPPAVLEWAAEQHDWPLEMFAEGGPMPSTVVNRPLTEGNGVQVGPLKVLELQVHAATLGAPVTITQLDYWLELVRKAATSGSADDERRAKHERVVERHRQVQADKARSAQQRPPAQPKRGRG